VKNYSLALVLVLSLVSACGGSSSDPEAKSRLNAAMEEVMRTGGGSTGLPLPGAGVDYYTPPREHLALPHGMADLEQGVKMPNAGLFHAGSITKTFTAAWIMQLDQEGALSIEDPLSKYFSYPNGSEITLRHLLSHTSGIENFTEMSEFEELFLRNPYPTPEEVLDFCRQYAGQLFPPGTQYSYSNTNYYMLGLIGEQVTGRKWADEMHARFIGPYKLQNTYIYGHDEIPASVTGYTVCADDSCSRFALTPTGDDASWKLGWAAGSIVSSPQDLTRWMYLLVEGDVLDAAHRAAMQTATPQSEAYFREHPENISVTGVGLCLWRYYSPGVGVGWGHEGEIAGFANTAAFFPESNFGLSLLINLREAYVSKHYGALLAAVAGR